MCVANFPSSTGYAWSFIGRLFQGLAVRLHESGVRTVVVYPEVDTRPVEFEDSPIEVEELVLRLANPVSLLRAMALVRRLRVRVLYLSDRPIWHPAYVLLRLAGVRHIVVHDHTSGERTRPHGVKRMVKHARFLVPGALADVVVAVSDFVARRKVEVDLVPPSRVYRIWNAVEVPDGQLEAAGRLREEFGIEEGRPVVICVSRAADYKGVPHLLRAFDEVVRRGTGARPVLLHLGDGPDLGRWKQIREGLDARDDIIFGGYRESAATFFSDADVAVVPSVWAEAFGLTVLEAMVRGIPVIASRVGGIPEIVGDEEGGLLVPPGDEEALADALERLLADPDRRRALGRAGRQRGRRDFVLEEKIDRLAELVAAGFGVAYSFGGGGPPEPWSAAPHSRSHPLSPP